MYTMSLLVCGTARNRLSNASLGRAKKDRVLGMKRLVSQEIAEWDYGGNEELGVGEIRRKRRERGLDEGGEWNIWRDGCEGGE